MSDEEEARAGKFASPYLRQRVASAILDICRGCLLDGAIVDREIMALHRWAEANPIVMNTWEGKTILTRVHAALADGMVDEDERRDIHLMLEELTAYKDQAQAPTTAFFSDPLPPIQFVAAYTLTGTFLLGLRFVVEELIKVHGGEIKDGLSAKSDVLLVGSRASAAWIQAEAGTKLIKVQEISEIRKKKGKPPLAVIPEAHWAAAVPDLNLPPA